MENVERLKEEDLFSPMCSLVCAFFFIRLNTWQTENPEWACSWVKMVALFMHPAAITDILPLKWKKGETSRPLSMCRVEFHPLGYHLSAEVGNEEKNFVDVSLSIVIFLETPSD